MKAKTPKSKPKFEWTDVPARLLPRNVSFVLEDILTELRQIREAMEKTGAYPIPNPSYPNWNPVYYVSPGLATHYSVSSGINAPGEMAAPPGCYTQKELEDKFGARK